MSKFTATFKSRISGNLWYLYRKETAHSVHCVTFELVPQAMWLQKTPYLAEPMTQAIWQGVGMEVDYFGQWDIKRCNTSCDQKMPVHLTLAPFLCVWKCKNQNVNKPELTSTFRNHFELNWSSPVNSLQTVRCMIEATCFAHFMLH